MRLFKIIAFTLVGTTAAVATPASAVIVNISGTQNGEETGGANCFIACEGALINAVQVTFAPGTYTFYDAYNPITGLAPGALYDAWNYNTSQSNSWAWHWKALRDDGSQGSTINPDNYASYILLDIDSTQSFPTESAAAAFGAATPPPSLTFAVTTTVNFVVNDYYLADNDGGVSLDVRQDEIGDAVPEPATWAMMVCSFGLVGGAMRRRGLSVSYG